MKPASILTPLQHEALDAFFSTALGSRFFLTGGTALAEYYLQHRYSDDLDLFTTDDEALALARQEVLVLGPRLAVTVESVLSSPTFQRFLLTRADMPPLQIDLVRDVDVQFGSRQRRGAVIVDAIENIAVNKVTAIFGRTASKDFVDLYFLLEAGQHLPTLIEHAKQKDAGLTEFWLAGMFRQADRLNQLPAMLKPVSLDTIKAFYAQLAAELMRDAKPPE
jgi:hypothetical protein